jgi:hypothetical protein
MNRRTLERHLRAHGCFFHHHGGEQRSGLIPQFAPSHRSLGIEQFQSAPRHL